LKNIKAEATLNVHSRKTAPQMAACTHAGDTSSSSRALNGRTADQGGGCSIQLTSLVSHKWKSRLNH